MQTVLVTGAGSGLGLASALLLASSGYRVYGTVLTEEEAVGLKSEAQSRGLQIEVHKLDITDEAAVNRVAGTIIARAGRLDQLVHFAGVGLRGFFEDLSSEEIRRAFDINFFGTVWLVRAVLPHMRANRSGRLVLTTSIAGRMPSMSIGGYAASKWAVEGLAETLRQELALFNIWVTLLEPGLISTPIFSKNRNLASRAVDTSSPYHQWFRRHEEIVDGLLRRNRFGPDDVASVVLQILKVSKPKLRYVVGAKAKVILGLRRHIPGELFQNVYWGLVRRMVTKPSKQTSSLHQAEAGQS